MTFFYGFQSSERASRVVAVNFKFGMCSKTVVPTSRNRAIFGVDNYDLWKIGASVISL